ncbi:glycosyltransferase family 2 protein [Pedobacter glucosidilyticus]|uniref:glycosyltransferase family 2 protein n=1 Tax=Pedobacter glucosidilyticus TaxID=1122941 RepID=UPI0026EF77B0|nr:glycosyltransferase family 2 protein [Pedobacter glucosidilyticus]
MYKISVITINFNNKTGLEKTIQSVIYQTYPFIEYIIIDGGSTDGSVEVIKKYEDKITYWVSEPDRGIYHAMNKGVEKATGDYLLMLNSGDYLISNNIINQFAQLSTTEAIVYGDLKWEKDQSLHNHKFDKELSFRYFLNNSLGHQAMFIHKSIHKTIGLYDEDYKITADWKLILLAYSKFNLPFRYINLEISICPRDGISCNPANWTQILSERKMFLEKEFKTFLPDYDNMQRLENDLKTLKQSYFQKIKRRLKKYILE